MQIFVSMNTKEFVKSLGEPVCSRAILGKFSQTVKEEEKLSSKGEKGKLQSWIKYLEQDKEIKQNWTA